MSGRSSVDFLHLISERARLAETVDFRRCSTLFDFPRVDRRCFICRLRRIFEDCILWEYSILPNYSDFRKGYRRCFNYGITRISKYQLLRRFSICRITRIFKDVRQCSIFPEVVLRLRTEDALFAELGGFPKINFVDSARFAELVG